MCRQGEAVFRSQIGNIVGSDLSPMAAECRPISACSTQNKAKRANKIVFLLLIRDQEVDGSNPFAPTNLLESAGSKIRVENHVACAGLGCCGFGGSIR